MSKALVAGMAPPALPVRLLKGAVLLVICAVVIIPFIGIVSTSVAGTDQINASGGFVLFPKSIDLGAYLSIFAGGVVTRALLVSVLITAVGTVISLLGSALLAYALSRPGSFGHKPMLMLVLFTLLFTPGIIPNYLVVKQFGLLNSYWSLILPTALNAFNVIVLRSFFTAIPRELIESARIDRAGEITILRYIVLPLSKAVLAVIGLFYAVSYWNAFFNALLYINDNANGPCSWCCGRMSSTAPSSANKTSVRRPCCRRNRRSRWPSSSCPSCRSCWSIRSCKGISPRASSPGRSRAEPRRPARTTGTLISAGWLISIFGRRTWNEQDSTAGHF